MTESAMKQRTKRFALRVMKLTGTLSKDFVGRRLGDQLYICVCQGMAEYIPGLVAAEEPLVEALPRIKVAGECYDNRETDAWWRAFAEVFNQELPKHLLQRKQ